ncbi:MAG: preprotein translocase subunit SecG [Ignavibacteriae bacterium]|nr:preprotein translocase subunit SecG [Ignavibacteriota bacterium]
MFSILAIIGIIGAILLILAVLLQPGKGDLTATFGGLSAQFGAVFGMQRANDLLAKVTKVIAAIILILIIASNKFFIHTEVEQMQKPVTQGAAIPADQSPLKPPPAPLPQQGQ